LIERRVRLGFLKGVCGYADSIERRPLRDATPVRHQPGVSIVVCPRLRELGGQLNEVVEGIDDEDARRRQGFEEPEPLIFSRKPFVASRVPDPRPLALEPWA
jgi:hypothetical protein